MAPVASQPSQTTSLTQSVRAKSFLVSLNSQTQFNSCSSAAVSYTTTSHSHQNTRDVSADRGSQNGDVSSAESALPMSVDGSLVPSSSYARILKGKKSALTPNSSIVAEPPVTNSNVGPPPGNWGRPSSEPEATTCLPSPNATPSAMEVMNVMPDSQISAGPSSTVNFTGFFGGPVANRNHVAPTAAVGINLEATTAFDHDNLRNQSNQELVSSYYSLKNRLNGIEKVLFKRLLDRDQKP